MPDRDVEGTKNEWGIKVSPPNPALAPYFLTFTSKEAAQHVIDTEATRGLPCELVFRIVTTGAWRHDAGALFTPGGCVLPIVPVPA